MSNQPEMTIDDLRISVEFGGIPPKQGDVYEFPLTEPVRAALSAMVNQVIGDNEIQYDVSYGLTDAVVVAKRDELRNEQRQRAEKLGFIIKEDK